MVQRTFKRKTVDQYLNEVNYTELANYVPTEFSVMFINFIKLVNGGAEANVNPPAHYKMIDGLCNQNSFLANLCSRGLSKTSLFVEYFIPFLAIFQHIPNFGSLNTCIFVGDTMENGVKNVRKNIESRYERSDFLKKYLPKIKFTDGYIEFQNISGQKFGIKLFGAKALALDEILYTPTGTTTIKDVEIGTHIIGADGKLTTVLDKSEIFHRPMYEIELKDGRKLKVCEEHLNQVWIKKFKSDRTFSTFEMKEGTYSTKELLQMDMYATDTHGCQRPLMWIENIKPMEIAHNHDLLIDPYTVGVLIGDGSLNTKTNGNTPVVLTAHTDDWETYEKNIPYSFGKPYQKDNAISRTIIGLNDFILKHGLNKHGNLKEIPQEYLFSSIQQRLALLQGLMDTDGSACSNGKSTFSSNSEKLVKQVMWLVRSLGGYAYVSSTGKTSHFKCVIELNMSLFRLPRKVLLQKTTCKKLIAIKAINRIADEPSQCIRVSNKEAQFVAGEGLIRTHNTGLRGTKIFGQRPQLALLDDLVSDEDARSPTVLQNIKDTIYKGVLPALDPNKRKVVFNGTPFTKDDPLYEAVESGEWVVNVYPVCEEFPCERKNFKGAWEDRFTYESIQESYNLAVGTGQVKSFRQEYMLRIASVEDRMVLDDDIRWFKTHELLEQKQRYNYVITTDFATSTSKKADYTVIGVWAIDINNNRFLVDGVYGRQLMNQTFDNVFSLVQKYNPQQVGIEISGQQGAFISLLRQEMMKRNTYFTLARGKDQKKEGIPATTNKMSRFNLVVPLFKAGHIYLPEDLRHTNLIQAILDQLEAVTIDGIKAKNDDCIDMISQMEQMYITLPDPAQAASNKEEITTRDPFEDDMYTTDGHSYNDYLGL